MLRLLKGPLVQQCTIHIIHTCMEVAAIMHSRGHIHLCPLWFPCLLILQQVLLAHFQHLSQLCSTSPNSYHQGATSPPNYQAHVSSRSVSNHPLFNRPPSVLDSLQIPLLPLLPTTTPVLNHTEVEGLLQSEPGSVPTTTKWKRKTVVSKPMAKRWKKTTDAMATPAAAPCGVGTTILASDMIKVLPQLLHAYTDPTMSFCG